MQSLLPLLRDLAVGGFLYVLPGWAMLRAFGPSADLDWKSRAGLAPALSLSVYPLLYLFARLAHVPVTLPLILLPGILGAAGLVWMNRGRRIRFRKRPALVSAYFIILLAVVFISRMIAVRGLVAPSWGDSVHHTMIVRLLVENRGLFSSWAPYASINTFTYHFGFHAAAAAWSLTAGVPAVQAVLAAGQVLNGLAVLVLYPIGVRLGRSAWAGLGAVATAGLFSVMPGFSVNWGRYTQLTSLAVIPVLIWFLDVFWRDVRRPKAGTIGMLSLLFAGMFMAHYRVAVIALAAAAAWSLRALWQYRKALSEWLARIWRLGFSGLGSLALISPWLPVIMGGGTPQRIGTAMRADAASHAGDIGLWKMVGFYIGPVFWITGLVFFVVALFRNRRLAASLALWLGIGFAATNPFLLRLPGTGIVSNFVLMAMLYVPISWLAGSAVGEGAAWLERKTAGRIAVAVVFAASLAFGFVRQSGIVDPFFVMVEKNDVAAFRWIRLNTPRKSRFLTNAITAFDDSVAVGTDAGWWLPYFTRRWIPFLPLLFSAERLPPGMDPSASMLLVKEIRATEGDPEKLARIFLRERLDHVFLGEKRGMAAYGAVELLPETWLRSNPYFIEEARFGAAMIWRFDSKTARASLSPQAP